MGHWYAIHGFVPLLAHSDWRRADAGYRARVFADAYGLDEAQRRELVRLLAPRTRAMNDFLATQARLGNQPWTRLWQEGHGRVWRADAEYVAERQSHWSSALLD